ncbi:MAG: ABC transporter substrate-binding protein [Lacrimispora sp.]|uniref:ABC transporter substrate-binding protein n=1 Tax=Lacrimispora sp. TaxID=2719234 RepID=UPI0039E5953E
MWKKTMKTSCYMAGLVLCITVALSACKSTADTTGSQAQETQTTAESTAAQSGQAAEESSQASQDGLAVQEVTDHAGRKLELPGEIKSVYSTSPIGTMLMYTFDDRMVAGVNVIISDAEKAYLTDYYVNLPHLGGWYGKGNQGNIEEIIKAAPDVVLSSGTDQGSIDQAEQLQKQLGIPVVLVKSDLQDLPETYRFLGKLFNREDRGEELASYTEATLDRAKEITAKIPEDKKIRVYYAEEQDGLHTDPSGSSHSQLIDLCGGINVADCEITPGYGRTAVTIEQVMQWAPELIICSVDNGFADSSSYTTVTTDSKWSTIPAVKSGLVFETPMQPQNWFDRPPSVNTIIGIKWVHSILYPEYVDYDIKEETKEFYKLFYHVELSDEDVETITKNALRK